MLNMLRDQIDIINRELAALLGKRLHISKMIAEVKKQNHLPILDEKREKSIHEELKILAKRHDLNASVLEKIFTLIINYTKEEMELI